VTPLFPGYCFTRIELQWHAIRQCPGVIRVVRCGGDEPSHLPDEVIAEIRARERTGAIELPKCKLKAGDRVQINSGLLASGRDAGTASRKHIKVLLNLRGRLNELPQEQGWRRIVFPIVHTTKPRPGLGASRLPRPLRGKLVYSRRRTKRHGGTTRMTANQGCCGCAQGLETALD
jgi:hypothetical protein